MSVVSIRAALETALNSVDGMWPALQTAWENQAFAPVAGTPYQRANILFAKPDNSEYGRRHQERGYMQVRLMYPLQVGTAGINARADVLRDAFYRGNTFSSGDVTVIISETPEVSPGIVDGDRYSIPVKIPFTSNIG